MRVSHLPSGNSICMFHIAYQSTIKYLFKFPQHNALFLLSETVFLLITSSKSIFFPAKHHFTFHLIPDKFLPIYLEYNSGCTSQRFLGPWLSNTHTTSFTEVKTNYLTDERYLLHKQGPHHTLEEAARELYCIHGHHRLAKTIPWLGIPTGTACALVPKKSSLLSTIPPAPLKESPWSVKGTSLKGAWKDNPGTSLTQDTGAGN